MCTRAYVCLGVAPVTWSSSSGVPKCSPFRAQLGYWSPFLHYSLCPWNGTRDRCPIPVRSFDSDGKRAPESVSSICFENPTQWMVLGPQFCHTQPRWPWAQVSTSLLFSFPYSEGHHCPRHQSMGRHLSAVCRFNSSSLRMNPAWSESSSKKHPIC